MTEKLGATSRSRPFLAVLCGMLVAATAWASKPDALPRSTITADEVVKLLEELGHDTTVKSDSSGDPLVMASHEGTSYSVLFYGCAAHRTCTSIQFRAWYDLTTPLPLDRINEWNRTSLLGRAYLDKDDDATIEHTVRLAGGVTVDHLKAERDWFMLALREFEALVSEFQGASAGPGTPGP